MNNTEAPTLLDLLEEIKKLREDIDRHEKLLDKIVPFYQQPNGSGLPTWSPVEDSSSPIRQEVSLKVVRRVERQNEKSRDILTRLKATWFGRLYTDHLKKYTLVRSVSIFVWHNVYPFYVRRLASPFWRNRADKRWRPLTKLSEFSTREKIPTFKLADACFVKTPPPEVFPIKEKTYLVSPHESYEFPELYVAQINKGTVYGGTNLLLAGDEVICHDLYDFERDFTSEELHGRTFIDPESKRIRWLLHDKDPEVIPALATFVDACAPNYAHWVTEVLPRIALFCNDRRFEGVPIVVNEGLHKNIMASLALVVGTEREIIILSIGRAIIADTLFVTSVVGYVPFERRNNTFLEYSHGLFSPRTFTLLNEKIGIPTKDAATKAFPKKIYLRRNSGMRKIFNSQEIEKYFQSIGYAIVEPERLSFLEQVMLFSNADVIVGSSGAALANLIFAQKDAKIFIFIPKFKDTSYWYWQNIACATGKAITYVFGLRLKDGIHSDFIIDINDLSVIFEGDI